MNCEDLASDPFIYTDYKIYCGDIDLTKVVGYNTSNISKRYEYEMYECSKTCGSQYYCPLTNRNLTYCCPYVTNSIHIKEPRARSKKQAELNSFIELLELREHFHEYTTYVFINRNKVIDKRLFLKLKQIPVFSFENITNDSYEELKKNITINPQENIPRLYTKSSLKYSKFVDSLLDFYKLSLNDYRDGLLCRVLMDEEDKKYLEWKDQQDSEHYLRQVYNDFYYIDLSNAWVDNVSVFLHKRKNNWRDIYFFFIKDLDKVIEYVQSLTFRYDYARKFLLELLTKLRDEKAC